MSDPMNVLAPEHRRLRIGDAWRDAASGATFAVEDPATGKTIAEVADAGVVDGLAALDAANKAMAEWAATPPRKRSELLTATYRALTERSEEVARLITLEMGKPLAEARERWPTAPSSSAGSPRRRCASKGATTPLPVADIASSPCRSRSDRASS